jgi:Uma2 family endonuclease
METQKETWAVWLGVYRARHPELRLSHNATVRLDADNEVQPDLCLRRVTGGTARELDGYLHGPPELVAEIAASSVSIDLHDKKRAYRRAGVQEYIVWRVLDGVIEWWQLVEGEYVSLEADERGLIHSHVFPSLRLDPAHLVAGDLATALAALD